MPETPLTPLPHPAFAAELVALQDRTPKEAVAVGNAVANALQLGSALGHPHVSAVRGWPGLRELRPRAGHSPWRVLCRRHPDGLALLALAPEAVRDRRGFRRACELASIRYREVA